MANLTEAKQRDFSRQVLEVLKSKSAELSEAGFDSQARIAELETKSADANTAEAEQRVAEEVKQQKTAASNAKRTELYEQASATVSLMEGLLGRSHQIVHQLRQVRGRM